MPIERKGPRMSADSYRTDKRRKALIQMCD